MNIHKVYSFFMRRFRPKRLAQFKVLCPEVQTLIRILDVGGVAAFPWAELDTPAQVTLLNIGIPPKDMQDSRFTYVEGDGCHLPYEDKAFDLVFSNSVIEHVGDFERQKAFAEEIKRVGKRIYLQTPNRWFFMEPHLIAPLIHFLAFKLARHLVRWFSLWGWVVRPSQSTIDAFLKDTRLLTAREIRALFPGFRVIHESFLGMTKSFIVISEPIS
jgi:ubiquinone/menaquinone biosynthesis C-methylase UbiE